MTIHENSLKAYEELKPSRRRKIIFEIYKNRRFPMTDRGVCSLLGFSDMNMVRPRITELVKEGFLVEVGKEKDFKTGKTVRICKAREKNANVS